MKFLNKIYFIALIFFVCATGNSVSAEVLVHTTATANFTFTRNLTLGINGDDVFGLQQFLINSGFLKIATPTGYFGSLTRTALSLWQAEVGIYPSVGFFGPVSRGRINTIVEQMLTNVTPALSVIGTTTTLVVATNTPAIYNRNGSPVLLIIPKLNIVAGFQYTGLKADGTMEIPNNIVDVGWFTSSPRPGESGNAIITGHVAQIRGGVMTKTGVFYHLGDLHIGDRLYILNDKGELITFAVRGSQTYDPAADANSVFASVDSGAHLNLITCEGSWNPAQSSYSQRLVVFTDKEVSTLTSQ